MPALSRIKLPVSLLALAVSFIATFALQAGAAETAYPAGPVPAQRKGGAAGYAMQHAREAASAQLCEAEPNRMFTRHRLGSACIAYYATDGREDQRRAVVFFDGDVTLERYADKRGHAAELQRRQRQLQTLANQFGVRMVRVSRLGVEGSSGNHGDRRKPEELVAMDAALDILKQRLGLDELVLAGQSGGSTLIASLLTRGRSDVSCAVLGSGAYELVDLVHTSILRNGGRTTTRAIRNVVYDPSTQIEGIVRNSARRMFIVGDPADARTPLDQQARFVDGLVAAGHHARLVRVKATGELNHGAAGYTLPLAALCARNASDARMAKAARDISANLKRQSPGGRTEAAAASGE